MTPAEKTRREAYDAVRPSYMYELTSEEAVLTEKTLETYIAAMRRAGSIFNDAIRRFNEGYDDPHILEIHDAYVAAMHKAREEYNAALRPIEETYAAYCADLERADEAYDAAKRAADESYDAEIRQGNDKSLARKARDASIRHARETRKALCATIIRAAEQRP